MAGPSHGFVMPTQPDATFAMLNGLQPALDSAFPINDSKQRPDTGGDDSETELLQKGSLIRIVVGGWISVLAGEEGKDGSHAGTNPDSITTLSNALPGPLQYLTAKPHVLLFRPRSAAATANGPKPNEGIELLEAEQDLASFFFARIIRSASSLEAALLLDHNPSVEADSDSIYRKRESLRITLEDYLATIIKILVDSAASIEWEKKEVVTQGGIGKARELVNQMVDIVKNTLILTRTPDTHYPQKIRLFGPPKSRSLEAAMDPFDQQPSLTILSSIHARAMILTTLRILFKVTTASIFFTDFVPTIHNLLLDSWPSLQPHHHNSKGKQKMEESKRNVIDATMSISLNALENSSAPFTAAIVERIIAQVGELYRTRLHSHENGLRVATVDSEMMNIYSRLWERVTGAGIQSDLRQILTILILENSNKMVECLINSESSSAELQAATTFILATPFTSNPLESNAPASSTISTLDLLSSEQVLSLATFATTSSRPPSISDSWSPAQLHNTNTAWTSLRTQLLIRINPASGTPRKRKRSEAGVAPSLNGRDEEVQILATGEKEVGKKKKWRDSVRNVLSLHFETVDATWEAEGLENYIATLAISLPTQSLEEAIKRLKVIGMLGCAREGTLASDTTTESSISLELPSCTLCDAQIDARPSLIPEVDHLFTKTPLEGMRKVASYVFQETSDPKLKLAYMQALTRLLRHSRSKSVLLNLAKDPIAIAIYEQLEASSRNLRLAAGNLLLSIIRAHQDQGMPPLLIDHLSKRLDVYLGHKSPAVIETTLIIVGRIARLSIPQGWLECQCITKFVCRLGHPNMYLKSLVRTQFEQIAIFRNVKPYALVQPHFETISPILVDTMQTSPATIAAALDCFQQSREAVLRLTREYTLPKLVLQDRMTIIKQIAEASDRPIAIMLVDPSAAPAIFAYLYMQPDAEQRKGLAVYMREAGACALSPTGVITLHEILNSVKIPLVYRLALQLGDDDSNVQEQAQRALRSVERARNPSSAKSIDLGTVLKDSIVGILSLMNRGLNESTAHRPLRSKQKIIRSLEVVTAMVGPAIAGFSPQIMATIQSALEVEGLRGVALNALKTFFVSLKFGEIGPFIGTTTATFVRLWPSLTPSERVTAAQTIDYIVIENSDNLVKFVQDIADLSGISELAVAHGRLQQIRKGWSFDQRSNYLLTRVGSENDVVSLQALQELKNLMLAEVNALQAYSASDSFDKSIGRLVKVLFGAATKDGRENEATRNVAFECIGILGALDPDRLDIVPTDSAIIILQNFTEREEATQFALHLIQDLLIGAYRSTNDTKHQEVLAYAIQELLRFCGFTVELVLHSIEAAQSISSKVRDRWNGLPKSVHETCGPLLGASFSVKQQPAMMMTYPIYSSTSSYRDWIRSWATDLILKLKESKAKEIFDAFPPVLRLEDIAVAQHLLPHLVLSVLISGPDKERTIIKNEMQKVLEDQVDPKAKISEHSRLLSAQTVFDLMDHMSRWTHKTRQDSQKKRAALKKQRSIPSGPAEAKQKKSDEEILYVEGVLQDIPQMLVAQAAFNCKAYARALLSYESRLVAARSSERTKESDLQDCYEKLHKCYADLDEPDGMEGVTTKIVSPSIWHQIREHESTGRWTSAQSCWEVKLQQSPEDPACHIGLLQCLRNLGHYDSMRTHIVGILHIGKENVEWERILAPFNIEASLIVGDWNAVEQALQIPDLEGPQVAFGRVITAMRHGANEQLEKAFYDAREQLGGPIVAAGKESYRRVYDSVINLHILHELEMIRSTVKSSTLPLVKQLSARVNSTSPAFRAREPIFNMRRTAFSLDSVHGRKEIGELWLETSKIARKAAHSQTAYSAILQANNLNTPFVFLQSAKLLKSGDQMHKAIQELDNALANIIPTGFSRDHELFNTLSKTGQPSILAKSSLRRARWMHEAGRLDSNGIISAYQEACILSPDWESPYYYLGHYWDQISISIKGVDLIFNQKVIKLFSDALLHGTKFIYQALPRMLTIWFKFGEHPELVKLRKATVPVAGSAAWEPHKSLLAINRIWDRNVKSLPSYQWLTVLPQLVSRVTHTNEVLVDCLKRILHRVLISYPHHTFWAMASGAKSSTTKRSRHCMKIFDKAKQIDLKETSSINIPALIIEGLKLVDQLLILCNHPVGKEPTMSLHTTFPNLYKLAPTTLMIPLQASLNVSLPSDASQIANHKPFPDRLITFQNFHDDIDIMTSLQKPRKITIHGDDGLSYAFLCKPKDDLRKDARLMEFNSMIIKLLKKDSESRNRRLGIRTYAVVPLNEECGLIEWVPNVVVLRTILNKAYASRGIVAWSPELKTVFETIRDDPEKTGMIFERDVLSRFPSVFHEWFLETFPEPSAWFRARLAYSRTAAVISIVGFVLGLGDRHCENILLEGNTGDTVHVDFNCLFDKGRTFDVGEKVPFRLTHNIIDGMGVTGVEGVFRKAAEITLRILRDNKESLTSVLETFVHDPLVEWSTRRRGKEILDQEAMTIEARKNLDPVDLKLRGLQVTSDPASVGNKEVSVAEQVERLIRDARSSKNLGSMYVGWAPML